MTFARRGGCQSLIIGFESLDKGNLRQMGKDRNLSSDFETRLVCIRDAGIMLWAAFLLGYRGFGRGDDYTMRKCL